MAPGGAVRGGDPPPLPEVRLLRGHALRVRHPFPGLHGPGLLRPESEGRGLPPLESDPPGGDPLPGLPGWGGFPLPHLPPAPVHGALSGAGMEARPARLPGRGLHLRLDPGSGAIEGRCPPGRPGLPVGPVHGHPGEAGARREALRVGPDAPPFLGHGKSAGPGGAQGLRRHGPGHRPSDSHHPFPASLFPLRGRRGLRPGAGAPPPEGGGHAPDGGAALRPLSGLLRSGGRFGGRPTPSGGAVCHRLLPPNRDHDPGHRGGQCGLFVLLVPAPGGAGLHGGPGVRGERRRGWGLDHRHLLGEERIQGQPRICRAGGPSPGGVGLLRRPFRRAAVDLPGNRGHGLALRPGNPYPGLAPLL